MGFLMYWNEIFVPKVGLEPTRHRHLILSQA